MAMLDVVILSAGPLFTLEEAKEHLHEESSDHDALVETYSNAAVLSCLNYCDRAMVPMGAEPAFKAAALLTLGSLYKTRESVLTGETVALNPNVEAMLRPYRTYRA